MAVDENEMWGYEYTSVSQTSAFFDDSLVARLNDLSVEGWRVVSTSTVNFTGSGNLEPDNPGLFVILERKRTAPPARPKSRYTAPSSVYEDDGTEGYDPSRIPADRFYRRAGNVSKALKADGFVTDEQLDLARAEFAKRGGHLLDHLFAYGFVDEATLRKKAYMFG